MAYTSRAPPPPAQGPKMEGNEPEIEDATIPCGSERRGTQRETELVINSPSLPARARQQNSGREYKPRNTWTPARSGPEESSLSTLVMASMSGLRWAPPYLWRESAVDNTEKSGLQYLVATMATRGNCRLRRRKGERERRKTRRGGTSWCYLLALLFPFPFFSSCCPTLPSGRLQQGTEKGGDLRRNNGKEGKQGASK